MMNKRKIILFSTYYPFGSGETFLHNEILALQKDFDIEVFPTLRKNKNNIVREVPHGVKYHEPLLNRAYAVRIFKGIFNVAPIIPYFKDLMILMKNSKNLKYSIRRWFLFLITTRAIIRNKRFIESISKKNDSIIYFYWGNFPTHLIKTVNSKIFMRVHGGEVNFERHFGYIPLVREKYRSKFDTVYLPISIDAFNRIKSINNKAECVVSRLGVGSLGVSPNPVQNDMTTIVSCSNIVSKKRVHLIIEALKRIENKQIYWVHFGDGPLIDKIQAKTKYLKPNIHFDFKGRQENTTVLNFYKENAIDLFINVSETEGVPVSIMEAMSCGIPCFATNVGGTSEILDETGGKLVNKDFEIKELSSYILNIKEISKTLELRKGAYNLWKKRCQASKNYFALKKLFVTSINKD